MRCAVVRELAHSVLDAHLWQVVWNAVVGRPVDWATPRAPRSLWEKCGNKPMTSKLARCGVLVVDDDQATRDTIRLVFEHEGYLVLEAPDGRSALKLLAISRSRLIVLLDWLLPDLDGVQVIQRHALAATAPSALQRVCPRPRPRPHAHAFILLTAANKSLADLPPGMSISVVRKPFDVSALLTLVKTASAARADGAEELGPR